MVRIFLVAFAAFSLPLLTTASFAQRSPASGYEPSAFRQSRGGRVQRPQERPREGAITARTPNRDGNFGGPGTGGGSGGP